LISPGVARVVSLYEAALATLAMDRTRSAARQATTT
jgi:hypothetical protein